MKPVAIARCRLSSGQAGISTFSRELVPGSFGVAVERPHRKIHYLAGTSLELIIAVLASETDGIKNPFVHRYLLYMESVESVIIID